MQISIICVRSNIGSPIIRFENDTTIEKLNSSLNYCLLKYNIVFESIFLTNNFSSITIFNFGDLSYKDFIKDLRDRL